MSGPSAEKDALVRVVGLALDEFDQIHEYPVETDDGMVMRCACGATPPSHLLGQQVDESLWLWEHWRAERRAHVAAALAADCDAVEYGVRFLPPHRNAGEAVWLPDITQVAQMVLAGGMAEAVIRRVGPWERKPCHGHHEDLDCRGLCGLVPQTYVLPPGGQQTHESPAQPEG